jgi:four helix bundle protein
MGQGAKSFEELRVWRAANEFKKAVYRLADTPAFRREARLRDQLREAAASAVSHISEGYARFEPGDQARFMRMAKASLVECQNHLIDAVDRGVITEEVRKEHDGKIESVLRQIGPFIVYLQSPQARKNAERIKRQRTARACKDDELEP